MTLTRISFFTRRGNSHKRLEDVLLVGPMIVNRPMPEPLRLELDLVVPHLFAVFDGVGGHPAGHRAALLGAAELSDQWGLHNRMAASFDLGQAIIETGRRISDEGSRHPSVEGMATTIAGVELGGRAPRAFNVGDSRAYVLQGRYLCPLTIDDVAETGGGLTQCLGAGFRQLAPHLVDLPWGDASVALLCTDGLYRHAGTDALERALSLADPIGELWHLAEGASDDVAVIVVDARPVRREQQAPIAAPEPVTQRVEQRCPLDAQHLGAPQHVRSAKRGFLRRFLRRTVRTADAPRQPVEPPALGGAADAPRWPPAPPARPEPSASATATAGRASYPPRR